MERCLHGAIQAQGGESLNLSLKSHRALDDGVPRPSSTSRSPIPKTGSSSVPSTSRCSWMSAGSEGARNASGAFGCQWPRGGEAGRTPLRNSQLGRSGGVGTPTERPSARNDGTAIGAARSSSARRMRSPSTARRCPAMWASVEVPRADPLLRLLSGPQVVATTAPQLRPTTRCLPRPRRGAGSPGDPAVSALTDWIVRT